MSDNLILGKNTLPSIRARYSGSNFSWWPVILFLPARLVFAFLAQGMVAGLFAFQGSNDAWHDAAAWWPVYSTITDLLTLLALVLLTRREGLTLIDLIGVRGKEAFKQLAWTPAYLLAVAPAAALASVITRVFYGSALPPMIAVVDLPPIGVWYSLIVWPVIWVIAEELMYLGYLLPRIEALSGKTWLAVLVVIFFWGLQHFAIPFIADGTYLVSRVLAAFAATGGMTLVFVLWRRRLVPLIGVHYIADLSTAILTVLPSLQNGG